jgi:hypothetical protein
MNLGTPLPDWLALLSGAIVFLLGLTESNFINAVCGAIVVGTSIVSLVLRKE